MVFQITSHARLRLGCHCRPSYIRPKYRRQNGRVLSSSKTEMDSTTALDRERGLFSVALPFADRQGQKVTAAVTSVHNSGKSHRTRNRILSKCCRRSDKWGIPRLVTSPALLCLSSRLGRVFTRVIVISSRRAFSWRRLSIFSQMSVSHSCRSPP